VSLLSAITALVLASCVVLPPLGAQATVRVDTGLAVTMRDGVVLRADLYRPPGAGRFPVLVYRTPYGRTDSGGGSSLVRAAVRRGHVVLLQDVRGRYGSYGVFEPYRQEGRDGYDTPAVLGQSADRRTGVRD
jgi:predicted acyl esterase